jgi:RNA recognition motif-containing protein
MAGAFLERYGQWVIRDLFSSSSKADGIHPRVMQSIGMPMCRRPKGFGFVEFRDKRDAEECLYKLDRTLFQGREISVSSMVFNLLKCSSAVLGQH